MSRRLTIRIRVALWCAGLVTVTGVLALVGVLYFTQHIIDDNSPRVRLNTESTDPAVLRAQTFALAAQNRELVNETVSDVRTAGIVGLVLLSGLSLGVGWLAAGRMLRPATDLAEAAEQISALNLDRRFAREGPEDELKSIADAFDRMLDRLDRAFVRQRRFVADASHELRTPFATMRTQVDVALADETLSEGDLRHSLAEIGTVVNRGGELVDAMLSLSRADAISQRQRIDLAEIAGEVLTAAPGIATLDLQTDLERAEIEGDPMLIGRLVSNLVDNAVAYNLPGGLLSVAVSREGDVAVLIVANDGPRLDEDEVAALFIRFRRLESAGSTRGFGLGLPVVAAIARAHDATITATARPQGGLEMRFEIATAADRGWRDGQGDPQADMP